MAIDTAFSGSINAQALSSATGGHVQISASLGVGGYVISGQADDDVQDATGGWHDEATIMYPGGAQTAVPEFPEVVPGVPWQHQGVSSEASGTMSGTIRCQGVVDAYDEPSGGSRFTTDGNGDTQGTGINTLGNLPNNLRQVHLRYVVSLAGTLNWSVTATCDNQFYDYDANTWAEATTTTVTASGSPDTLGAVLYDPADEFNAPTLPHCTAGAQFVWTNPSTEHESRGSASSTCTGVNANWGAYNDPAWTDPETGLPYVLMTQASGGAITVRGPGSALAENYSAYPDLRAGLHATNADWGGGAHSLRGHPACFAGDGQTLPVGAVATPYTLATQVHRNQTGPQRWYDRASEVPGRESSPASPVWSTLVGFPLDGASQRAQADYYGEHEALWIVPPDSPTWDSFTLGPGTAVIAVDDFTGTHPIGHEWTASGLGTGGAMTVSGSYRQAVVGEDATAAVLSRTFLSDWDTCSADPEAFAATLSAGAVKTFLTGARRGEWYRLARKVTAASDVFNWSNRRWLRVRGKMGSGTGTFTLRLQIGSAAIEDDYHTGALSTDSGVDPAGVNVRHVTATVGGPYDYDVSGLTLNSTDTTLYIDLAAAAQAANTTLGHVAGVELRDLQAGKTYMFDALDLVMGAAGTAGSVTEGTGGFAFWTGGGYACEDAIVPVVDGLPGARLSLNGADESALSTIYRCRIDELDPAPPVTYAPRDYRDRTRLLSELAADVNLQEGLSATGYAASATWGDCDWAIFTDAGWHTGAGAVSATVKGRDVLVPAFLFETWEAKGVSRGIAFGVCVDTGTHWPVSGQPVTVEGGKDGGTWEAVAEATTDGNGAFAPGPLPMAGITAPVDGTSGVTSPLYSVGLRFTAPALLDGSGDDVTATVALPNLGSVRVDLAGAAVAAPEGKDMSLAFAPTGFCLRAYPAGTLLRCQRRTWDGGGWTTLAEWAGTSPSVAWGLDGKPYCAYLSGASAVKLRDVEGGTDVALATGTHPQYAISANGALKALTYWRGSKIYCKTFDGQGNELAGGEHVVKDPASEAAAPVGFRLDGSLEVEIYNGTGVDVLVSTDLGRTWS